jgi:hypothetical protein
METFMTIDATSRMTPSILLFTSPEQIAAEFGGDVNASVAAMMLLHAKQLRESVQTACSIEEERLRIQEERQVHAMHEQADRIRSAGMNEGLGLIASGGFQIASGVVGIAGARLQDGQLSPRAAGSQAILQGSGSASRGVGEMFASEDNWAASIANADATKAENSAEATKRRLDELKEEMAQARDLTKTAIDFLRDQTRTKASTDDAAASIRA